MANKDLPRDDNGKLVSYAWPGGYPVYYLDRDNCCLCPDCARICDGDEHKGQCTETTEFGVHYEGEPITCEECNREIESAYGVPDGDDE